MIKAVRYFFERHYDDFISGAFLVDLKAAKSLKDIVAKLSKEFNRQFTDSDDHIKNRSAQDAICGYKLPIPRVRLGHARCQ